MYLIKLNECRHLGVVDVLLKYGSGDVNGLGDPVMLLHRAASGGYVHLVKKLIAINGEFIYLRLYG